MYGDFARWGRFVSRTVTKTRGFMAMAMPGFPYTTACSPNKNTLPGALHIANLDHRNTRVPDNFLCIPRHVTACRIADQFCRFRPELWTGLHHCGDRAVSARSEPPFCDPPEKLLRIEREQRLDRPEVV